MVGSGTSDIKLEEASGILRGSRIGQPITEADLLRAAGYSYDTHRVVKAKDKAWHTSMKDKDGEPMQVVNYYLELTVEPNLDNLLAQGRTFRDELLTEIRDEVRGSRRAPTPFVPPDKRSVLVEVDIFDPHFQKLAWGPETGTHQDLSITARNYAGAARDLIEEVRSLGLNVARWLFVIGQDLFHVDSDQMTTAKGTLQDVDSRTPKAARIVRKLLTDTVIHMLDTAPVDVLNVPGNHAPGRDWFMGEILDARFENEPNVSVDNRPISRKYYRYGNSLIGFSHGDGDQIRSKGKASASSLRDYMSQEARKDWGDTIYREWHLGHWHHEMVRDERGVITRFLPSISGTDAWHFKQGYVHAQRGARAYIWTPDRGMRHIIQHSIPVTPEELQFTAPLLRGDR